MTTDCPRCDSGGLSFIGHGELIGLKTDRYLCEHCGLIYEELSDTKEFLQRRDEYLQKKIEDIEE